MQKDLANYQDSRGWVGHYEITRSYDGPPGFKLEWGDGVQRTAMNYLFDYTLCLAPEAMERARHGLRQMSEEMYLESGEPVRHWSREGHWYTSPGTMSGDQIESYMWACVAMFEYEGFWKMWKKLFKRGFFAWNTKKIGQHTSEKKIPDFMLLRLISPTLRMLLGMPNSFHFMLYVLPVIALIWVWDLLWMPLNMLVRIIHPLIDREDTGDDLNFVVSLVGTKLSYATPFSFFSTLMYVGFRPLARLKSDPSFNYSQRGLLGAQSAFNQYFHNEAAPPLNEKASRVILWL